MSGCHRCRRDVPRQGKKVPAGPSLDGDWAVRRCRFTGTKLPGHIRGRGFRDGVGQASGGREQGAPLQAGAVVRKRTRSYRNLTVRTRVKWAGSAVRAGFGHRIEGSEAERGEVWVIGTSIAAVWQSVRMFAVGPMRGGAITGCAAKEERTTEYAQDRQYSWAP